MYKIFSCGFYISNKIYYARQMQNTWNRRVSKYSNDGVQSKYSNDGVPSKYSNDGVPSKYSNDGVPSKYSNDGVPSKYSNDCGTI
jgi:hypothetical protein